MDQKTKRSNLDYLENPVNYYGHEKSMMINYVCF